MAKKKDETYLKIVGMGYSGKLPGDKKREAKALKQAKEMLAAAETVEKRKN